MMSSDRGAWGYAGVTCAALAAALVFALTWTTPPSAVPPNAPPTVFSSGRARVHLEAIAQRPHPVGSVDHDRVRAYIVEQLRLLGLTPTIQETVSFRGAYNPPRFSTVQNILARRHGTGTGAGKALLLMAHYDTRGMTPGASDDGYGVAALLETARALGTAPLVSDVIFLFTDNEEEGLFGAAAFASEHPWARDVGAVLNVEARGNAGPLLMFQTGERNGALIRELARVSQHPAANSLSQAIYQRMPNDTDLSIFLPGTPSLNFANVGGFERYHAPTDTVANVSESTLQQGGFNLLAMTRALAARTLPLPSEPNATYFSVGAFFVRYPGAWDLPLALASALLLVVFVALGVRRGALRGRVVALAMLVTLSLVLVAAVGSGLLWAVARHLHSDYRLVNAARPALKDLYFTVFVTLGVAVVLATLARLRTRLRAAEMFAGAAAIVVALALVVAHALPGASFLFTLPVLAAMPVAIALAASGRFDRRGPWGVAAAVGLSVPVLTLVAPMVPQIYAAFGPGAAPAVGGITALIASLCAPAVQMVCAPAPRAVSWCVVAVGATVYVVANLVAPFDRVYPRPDTVLYAMDGNNGRASWLSPDPRPPAWCASLFAHASRGRAPIPFPLTDVLSAPAPVAQERGPEIVWRNDASEGDGRVHVRVTAPPGAELLAVRLEGARSARVAGGYMLTDDGVVLFRYYAPPREGVEIEVERAAGAALVLRAASQHQGLPVGVSAGTRPPESMPKPGMLPPRDDLLESDTTVVAVSSTH